MAESSAGKILSQTRHAKGLSIDEVSHATKLRPDKITALENDDYSRFGSIAYGRGFLQIYARYLGVDITEYLRSMESDNVITVSDYQYLNSPDPMPVAPRRMIERKTDRRERKERRAPSIIPLLVVLALGVAIVYGFYVVNAPRLGLVPSSPLPVQPATNTSASSTITQPKLQVAPLLPTPAAAPRSPTREPASNLSEGPAAPARTAPPVAAGDAAFLANVTHVPNTHSEDSSEVNELIVEPIKKTWVKIRKGAPDSEPIFEDYLYPGVRPLKLRGAKFFIEVRDQTAVQIRKNGRPIAYQAPGISVP